jgi:hypothetical protein
MVFHFESVVSLAVPLFVTMTVSCTLCGIILHYLTNKALGMQTLYDRVLKDLVKVFSLVNLSYTITIIVGHLFWPVPNILASVLFVGFGFLGYALAITFLVTLCIRYMLVYHTSIIDCIDENRLIWYVRLGVLITVTWMLLFDIPKSFSSHINPVYNILKTGNPGEITEPLLTIRYLLFTDVLGAVCLQFRLEYDAIMVYQEKHHIWFNIFCSKKTDEEGGYSLNTLRMFTFLCIAVIVSPIVVLQSLGQMKLFNLFIHFVMFAIIPLLAIVKNAKLKKHAKNMFVTRFTQVQSMYTVNV